LSFRLSNSRYPPMPQTASSRTTRPATIAMILPALPFFAGGAAPGVAYGAPGGGYGASGAPGGGYGASGAPGAPDGTPGEPGSCGPVGGCAADNPSCGAFGSDISLSFRVFDAVLALAVKGATRWNRRRSRSGTAHNSGRTSPAGCPVDNRPRLQVQ